MFSSSLVRKEELMNSKKIFSGRVDNYYNEISTFFNGCNKKQFNKFKESLKSIYDNNERNGFVIVEYITEVFYGKLL